MIAAKDRRHDRVGHVTTKERRKKDAQQKIKPRRAKIAAKVPEQSHNDIRVRVATLRLGEPLERKETRLPVEDADQRARERAAEKARDDANNERRLAQRHAVYDQLRVEEHGARHEGGEPVVANARLREARRNRDRAVHAQRRKDPERAG